MVADPSVIATDKLQFVIFYVSSMQHIGSFCNYTMLATQNPVSMPPRCVKGQLLKQLSRSKTLILISLCPVTSHARCGLWDDIELGMGLPNYYRLCVALSSAEKWMK